MLSAKINQPHSRLTIFEGIWSFWFRKRWDGQLLTMDRAVLHWTRKEYLIHIVSKTENHKCIRQITNRFSPSHYHCNQ